MFADWGRKSGNSLLWSLLQEEELTSPPQMRRRCASSRQNAGNEFLIKINRFRGRAVQGALGPFRVCLLRSEIFVFKWNDNILKPIEILINNNERFIRYSLGLTIIFKISNFLTKISSYLGYMTTNLGKNFAKLPSFVPFFHNDISISGGNLFCFQKWQQLMHSRLHANLSHSVLYSPRSEPRWSN